MPEVRISSSTARITEKFLNLSSLVVLRYSRKYCANCDEMIAIRMPKNIRAILASTRLNTKRIMVEILKLKKRKRCLFFCSNKNL